MRIPVPGRPETERAADHVPLNEIAQAALHFAHDARTIEQDELTRHVPRLFGWQRTRDGIAALITNAIDKLVDNGQIKRDGPNLRYAINTP